MSIRGKSIIEKLNKEHELTNETTPKKSGKNGRSIELIERRNERICYRMYYYAVFHKLNYETCVKKLSFEFDLAEFTLGKIIVGLSDKLSVIKKEKPTIPQLRKQIDFFNWKEPEKK